MALGALVVLALCAALAFAVRVLSLSRRGASFDCWWRCLSPAAGRGSGRWSLGVARVGADALEWWRVFSLSPRPMSTWHRTALEVQARRPPEPAEASTLVAGVLVVRCAQRGAGDDDTAGGASPGAFELAMSPEAYTGFASWLESSPPRARGGLA